MFDVDYFKSRYLNGLILEDANCNPIADKVYQGLYLEAKADFERKYSVRLQPTIVRVGHDNKLTTEPDHKEDHDPSLTPEQIAELPYFESVDAQDYDPRSFEMSRHAYLKLPIHPVQEVYGLGLELPYIRAGSNNLYEFPETFYFTKKRAGRIQIYWKTHTGAQPLFGVVGIGVRLLNNALSIPDAWHVSYLAGYTEQELKTSHSDVLSAVMKHTAIKALLMASLDANAAAGVTSRQVSADGLSQSINLVANGQTIKFGALIDKYNEELKDWEKTFDHRVRGVKVGFL